MKKCNKIYATIIYVIAVVLCYMVLQTSHDFSPILMIVSKSIEVLLPILGIGALIKYISCAGKGCCAGCKCGEGNCDSK